MASSSERQLKVKFVGDATSLKSTTSEVDQAFNKLGNTTRNVAAAFGLAFGASQVVSFLKGAADAAAEDERAQKLLALAITDNTTATAAQIAQTERWITTTQNATGVLDDQLRPALATLITATHDVGTAQQLMQTALDISAARGLDVETVALALTKAYNGATAGLSRLGIQIKDTSGNTLDFDQIMQNANETFGGAAAAAADTTAGKLAIMNAKFTDMKEQIGNEVLPIMIAFESFMLEHIIPVVSGFGEMIRELPGNMATGVAVTLNNLLTLFTAAANTIIGAVNVALKKMSDLPIFGVAGLGNILKYGGGILGGLIGGGSSKTQLDKITAPTIDVPFFPNNVTLPGAIAGLGGGGAKGDTGAGALTPGNASPPITSGGGGGGGGGKKGGKSAAELQAEADQKAIEETLKIWAQARIDKRDAEDNMYKDGAISAEKYKTILEQRLTEEKQYTNEWQAQEDKLTAVLKDEQDEQVKNAQKAADDLKKISDQRLKDMQEALNKTIEIQDNEYEVGAISADEYISILKRRLQGQEQFTNDWTRTWEKILEVERNAGMTPDTLASGAGIGTAGSNVLGGQQVLWGSGAPATNSTVGHYPDPTGGMTVSITNATFTAQTTSELYNQLVTLGRTNGGIAIPGGVRAVS